MLGFLKKFSLSQVLSFVGLVSILFSVLWFFQSDKWLNDRWYADDKGWNNTIIQQNKDILEKLIDIEEKIDFIERDNQSLKPVISHLVAQLGELMQHYAFHSGQHSVLDKENYELK